MFRWLKRSRQSLEQPSYPSLCGVCLSHARFSRLNTVYVYRNGHMLRTTGDLLPLDAWPREDGVMTFCGLDVYGMGNSHLYRMPTVAAPWDAGKL